MEEDTGVAPPTQEYMGVPSPTPEEQSSLYLPILSKRRRKPLKKRSSYPPAMVVKSTLDEENTVTKIVFELYQSNHTDLLK